MFISIVFSLLLVYITKPVVLFFEKRGLSRQRSAALSFSGIVIITLIVAFLILPFFSKLPDHIKNELPLYQENLYRNLHAILEYLTDKFTFLELEAIDAKVRAMVALLPQRIVRFLSDILPRAGTVLLLVPIFTFFFLKDGPKLKRWIISLMPNRHFEMALHILHRVNEQWARYIRGRAMETLLLSIFISLLLLPTGLSYILPLSLFVGITNLIPFFGPFIGATPPLIIALMVGLKPSTIIYIPIAIIVIGQIIDNVLLVPLLIARSSNLHPAIVISAIIMGGEIWGIMGMVIAVPVVSMINIFVQEVYAFHTFKGRSMD